MKYGNQHIEKQPKMSNTTYIHADNYKKKKILYLDLLYKTTYICTYNINLFIEQFNPFISYKYK